jgi:hypothetical protein
VGVNVDGPVGEYPGLLSSFISIRRSAAMKRKKLVALFLATAFALTVAAAPALAGQPKFNPNGNACQGPNDQVNCPGGPH